MKMERLYCSTMMIETDKSEPSHYLEIIIDNFDVNGFLDVAEAYVGSIKDALFCRLMERDFALDDPESVMLTVASANILGHDKRG